MTSTPFPVFVNPNAGGGGAEGVVREALVEAGGGGEVRVVGAGEAGAGELGAAIAGALAEGAERVGVAGGDGSLLTAANLLAGSGVVLAPFPTGTLNHFARRLGLGEVRTAARAAAGGATARVALGVMDEMVFLNTATFGLYADVVGRRERLRRWLPKWPAALLAILATLPRARPFAVTLEMEGERVTCRTPLLWVGMGAGSFPLVHAAGDARASAELEVVVFRPRPPLAMLALFVRIALSLPAPRRLRDDPDLLFLRGRRLLLQIDRPVGVTLDGELHVRSSPVFLGIQPDALAVPTRAP